MAVAARVAAWVGLAQAGRWAWWGVRAWRARRAGQPAPLRPGEQAAEPVAQVVQAPPGAVGASGIPVAPTGAVGSVEVVGMLGQTLEELASQMVAVASRYEPEGMLAFEADLRRMPLVFEQVATAFRILGERAGAELPVHAGVSEAISGVHAHQMACAAAAQEVHASFVALHQAELQRLQNPRRGEHLWDVRGNQ